MSKVEEARAPPPGGWSPFPGRADQSGEQAVAFDGQRESPATQLTNGWESCNRSRLRPTSSRAPNTDPPARSGVRQQAESAVSPKAPRPARSVRRQAFPRGWTLLLEALSPPGTPCRRNSTAVERPAVPNPKHSRI